MSLEEKIREFGQKRDTDSLQKCISDVSLNELLNLVQTRLSNSNFTYTWNYILQGFTENSDAHKKRFEVVMSVVQELEKNEFSSSHCNAIIRRICMDLAKFKTEHLLKLCDFCIECLQAQRASQMSWKELMPELLNVISEKECVEYNDEAMTGDEYKHQVINSICMLQWFPSNVTSLAEMFIDMSLTKEEHHQVVNKLGKYLEKLTPQEIPSFVYQLLRLCKQNNSRIVFVKLQQYFGLRHNNILSDQDTNSDSTGMDIIEDSSTQDTVEAEGTVLFHIHTSASLGQECVKDYLSFLKNMLKSPEFIIHPFQLSVLLTISTIPHYEERVFEIIRACVSKTYHEEQKKAASAWFREMVPSSSKVEAVFSHVIVSAEDRDLVLQGLVNFAFVLLGVGSALGRDIIAEKQWQLGNMILFKIIKRKRHTAPIIIEQLSNRIVTEQTVTHYIECLYMMSKNLSLLMLENKSLIVSLMEGLIQMPGSNAKQLLDAIIPLTKVSPTIRDHFILLLRKALYSRVTETRQVAVIGFLKLLTNLKISNLAVLSQTSSTGSFSSGHSLFTQISMSAASQNAPSAFSNEALCLEVLSILKRCFVQQAEVRVQLYAGLYNSVCLNPELGIPVLEMLWQHFREFYNVDEDTLPPLKFDKITVTRDVTVFLQEPLGNLVYTISLIATNVAKVDSENTAVSRFINILESICARMINCELVHFELDDGTDLTDIMPEAQQKLLVLKEAMCVYEALIGYKFHSWELESENNGKQINSLFQSYSRLAHFLKNINKPKKLEKKKKNANKTTQQTANNTTIKKDGQKSSKNLKMPDTVLNFNIMTKILSLLHEPMVSWTTIAQANAIKTKREFHQHIIQATLNLVSSVKNKKFIEVQTAKNTYNHLCEISTILYERVIKRLVEFIDFDCTTAILVVECFLMILNTINNNYKSNFQAFLCKVGGQDTSEDLVAHLSGFVKTYQKLFEQDDEEISEDPEVKKLSLLVANTLTFLAHQIPTNNNELSLQVMEWLKNYAVNNSVNGRLVAQSFVTLLFDCHIKFKVSLTLFEHMAVRIGDVTGVIHEEAHDVEEFKVIDKYTVNNVFTSLCSSIKTVLEDIDWIIARLRAEYSMINYPGEEGLERRLEHLKSRERGVCCQLCFIVMILTNLSNCTVPPGTLSEAVLKNLTLLYITLTSLTKYFILRSSQISPVFQGARFERLVKLAGKQLAPVVYKLIMYIEESQKEPEPTQKSKKKNVDTSTLKSKVLKETRLIPKVVYVIEQFSKFVMQLSKKTKIDLSKYVGQGTVRDFRILHLKEVLGQGADGEAGHITQESDASVVENDEENDSVEEVSPPPSKKPNIQPDSD